MNLRKYLELSAPFAIKIMWICLIVGPTAWAVGSALNMKMNSVEMASWAQAIGSIGAIIGTFTVSHMQLAKQARDHSWQELKKMHAYMAVIKHAVDQCRQAYFEESEVTTKGNIAAAWCGGYAQTFNSTLASLDLLAAHELADPDLVVAYTFILGEMKNIGSSLAQQSLLVEPDEFAEESFLLGLQCSVNIIEMHWDTFERYMEQNPLS